MAGLLELEEERRRNLALANPRSIAGLLSAVGENPNARMMSMAQDYARNLPQQLATNQQAMQSAIGGWNKTDFATGQPNPNYYPEAISELTQLMPNIGALTAWHGTPHNIAGKFDISKVGTGEGAQAYGHGMYFAENPNVAKEYQTVGGKGDYVRFGDKVVPTTSTEGQLLSDVTKLGRKAAINKYPDQADYIKTINPDNIKFEGGNLYKVDIPDEQIPNMLDWDKPLSAQPSIIEKLKGLGDAELSKLGINPDFTRRSTGKELTGESLYDVLTTHNSQKGASNLLAKLDIPGIRYFDQGTRGTIGGEVIDVFKSPEGWKSKVKVANRGGVGFSTPTDVFTTSMPFKTEAESKKWAQEKINAGTSNFVVFDPSTVKILEKNNQPIEGLLY